MNNLNFTEILRSGDPIHLIGIGGVSMRALAKMLKDMGAVVRGSDRDRTIYTLQLASALALGIIVAAAIIKIHRRYKNHRAK